jgi:hypothetical protein
MSLLFLVSFFRTIVCLNPVPKVAVVTSMVTACISNARNLYPFFGYTRVAGYGVAKNNPVNNLQKSQKSLFTVLPMSATRYLTLYFHFNQLTNITKPTTVYHVIAWCLVVSTL